MNRKAEKCMRMIAEKATTMMIAANAPANTWEYAVALATWLHNASPSSKTNGKSPDELVHGIQKDLSGLVPFYSKGWAYITKEEEANKKFKAKAHRVRFLGFAPEYKNCKILRVKNAMEQYCFD